MRWSRAGRFFACPSSDQRGRAGVERGHRRCHRTARGASQKKQRACYSGKKKRHTLKRPVAVDEKSGTLLAAVGGKGREHDFRCHCRRRHGLRTHLLAGLYNHDLNAKP